jgi:hypothetical protein
MIKKLLAPYSQKEAMEALFQMFPTEAKTK